MEKGSSDLPDLSKIKDFSSSGKAQEQWRGTADSELAIAFQLHQLDLEMQAEELQQANEELELQAEKLRESAAQEELARTKYHDLFEHAPVGYMVLDARGTILEVNVTAADMLTADRSALYNESFYTLLRPEEQNTFFRILQHKIQNQQDWSCELTMVSRMGRPFPARINGRCLKDLEGRKACRISFLDISDRVRARKLEALVKKQERKAMLEYSPDVIARFDLQGRLAYMNRTMEAYTGLPVSLMQGKTVQELFGAENPDIVGPIARAIDQVKATSRECSIQYRVATMLGPRWCSTMLFPVLDGNAVAGIMSITRDMTDQKEAEADLVRQKQLYQNLLENSPDVISRFDLAGRRIFINKAVTKYTEFSPQQLTGKLIEEDPCMDDGLKTTLREVFERVVRTKVEESFEFPHDAPQGRIYFQGRVIPEFMENEITTLLVVSREITALKVARDTLEEQVRRRTEDLEKLVRDLRREIEARRTAEQAALEASRIKNEFLANMSHEIRTPLSGILGLTELCLDMDLAPDLRDNLELVRKSGWSLSSVLKDILDFSKIQSRKMSITSESFALRPFVQETAKLFANEAKNKGIELNIVLESNLPEKFTADPQRLRQILVNLLSNALKFTEAGSVGLRLSMESSLSSHALVFTVSDTGIGIPKDRHGDVFTSFLQLDHTYTKRYGGTGLGLSISQELAGLMGGTIFFESEPGRGSTFSLRLPLQASDSPCERAMKSRPGNEPVSELPSQRILLAEDNKVNALFISRVLKQRGHVVQVAENGQEALEILAADTFDLVLMDVQMPVMDGLEATRWIKSRYPALPVIGLTAYVREEEKQHFLAQGMDGFVPKPVDFEELEREITRTLGKRPELAN
ncbi:MAG: PAS domain S-box protein [Desulfovibrionales bacterium]